MAGPQLPFVIQEHAAPDGVHWDLMLQMGDVLRTWRLAVHPKLIQANTVVAEHIFDHSLRFLTYEGPVQNQTGSVQIVERGTYMLENQAENQLSLYLQGEILKGYYKLTQQNSRNWLFTSVPTL